MIERRRDARVNSPVNRCADDVLRRVLGAAHRAPSVGLPWDFVLVRTPATRQRFREHMRTERDLFAASLGNERARTVARIKIEGIVDSSLGVVVTYDQDRGAPQVPDRHEAAPSPARPAMTLPVRPLCNMTGGAPATEPHPTPYGSVLPTGGSVPHNRGRHPRGCFRPSRAS